MWSNMGAQTRCLFWLLVLCELSSLLALGHSGESRNEDHRRTDSAGATNTDLLASSRVSRDAGGGGGQSEEGLEYETVTGGSAALKLALEEPTQGALSGHASQINAEPSHGHAPRGGAPRDAHRHKRATMRTGQATEHPESTEDKWVPLPKPLAQSLNQSEPPAGFTLDTGLFTEPEGGYEDATPFAPINTRPKLPKIRNPFYPLTSEAYGAYAIMILSLIIFTVGVIGNIAIMCIVCHNYYMRSISNSLLANLALWDFLIIFFCLPLVIFHELTKNWLLGEFSCKVVPYIEVNVHVQSGGLVVRELPLHSEGQGFKSHGCWWHH